MHTNEVEDWLTRIRDLAQPCNTDHEMAHIQEDEMREGVVIAIAEGATNAQDLAAVALTSRDIEFQRWCA